MRPIQFFPNKTLSKMRAAPLGVWGASLFSAFVIVASIAYCVEATLSAEVAPWLIALPTIAGTLALIDLWHSDADLWKFICHPFQRADRLHAQREAERKQREALEREQAMAHEAREQARRIHLWEVTRTDRSTHDE